MITDWVAKVLTVSILISPTISLANDLYMNQVGDDFELTITQDGENNSVRGMGGSTSKLTAYGNSQTMSINQTGNSNTVKSYFSGSGSDIDATQTGDRNTATLDAHGYYDGLELTQTGSDNIAHLEVGNGGDQLNYITGTQTGHNMNIMLEVEDGSNNLIEAEQYCTEGSSCVTNDMDVNVDGSNNLVSTVQGRLFTNTSGATHTDSSELGGLTMDIDITGNSNGLLASQRNQNANHSHNMDIAITGSSNSVFATQVGSGVKDIDITVNNDSNSISNIQQGNGSHTSTITLGGTDPTTLSVTQGGNTAQTYTLSQTCVTSGGCAITINQN